MGGYSGVVINNSHFSTTCTAVLVMDDDDDDDGDGAVRTYNCGAPHCWWTSDKDLQLWHALFTSWWGEGVITSYVSFMGCGVGPLLLPFGSPAGATQVHFIWQ